MATARLRASSCARHEYAERGSTSPTSLHRQAIVIERSAVEGRARGNGRVVCLERGEGKSFPLAIARQERERGPRANDRRKEKAEPRAQVDDVSEKRPTRSATCACDLRTASSHSYFTGSQIMTGIINKNSAGCRIHREKSIDDECELVVA